MKNEKIITLAIESSCDETSVAVMENGRKILSNVILSQIDIHELYGGVVPEIASRHHLESINDVVIQALDESGCSFEDIDFIAVTKGPGLVGALLVGVATAKAYSLALNKELVGVHHIHGHICSNFIEHKELEPPFIALVISGGHTNLVEVTDYCTYNVIGQTRDDAIGEAYDKVARVLGLGYPGGPKIDKIAKKGNREAIEFKRVMLEKNSRDFSFSGIKTAVLNYINTQKQNDKEIVVADVAASFQEAVLDVIVAKAIESTKMLNYDKLVLAGGVAANSRLKEKLKECCEKENINLYYPSLKLCTDNAAMIGCAAYYDYLSGKRDNLDLDASANIQI